MEKPYWVAGREGMLRTEWRRSVLLSTVLMLTLQRVVNCLPEPLKGIDFSFAIDKRQMNAKYT
jgi:hypothetical protein